MDKKHFFTLTLIIITALALTVFNSKLSLAQAQTSNQTYQLTVTGLVQNPLNLTLADIKTMPETTEYAALYCVDAPGTPLEQGNWAGVELSYLLQQANVSSGAVKVAFFATDGFTTDLTVQMATQDNNILVAYQLDNASLSGLRLVVPGNWGYKWINDLIHIQLVNYNFLGTEESSGYPDNAIVTATGGAVPFLQPNPSTPTQNSTPTPTALPQSPLPTGNPTTSPAASNPKPQSTSAFLVYIATVSIIVVVSAVVSVATLTKRKKTKTLKQEEAARAPSSL
jgi:DMSO/TMAO reductase YedYZ molybdopterin-dependent catalytic subunit